MTYDDRIRLNILSSDESLAVCDDDEYLIKADRLTSLFRLPSRVTWYDGLIDTGAMMTVLPQSIWSQHESAINWVKAPDNQQFPDWLCKVSGLTGGGFNCRVGVIAFQFCDVYLRRLPPTNIFVKCAEDHGHLKRTLIGLGGRTFEARRLEIDYSANDAWLHQVQIRS